MRSAEFEKVADLLARQHKITVKEGEGWACNIKTKDVFYRKKDIYTLPEDHILGLTLHEISHVHYTTDFKHPKDNPELIHTCMNMLEDHSVEHIISNDYPNAQEILDSTRQELMDNLVRILPKMNTISKHEKALLYASIRFEGRGYDKNTLDYEKLGDEISKIMDNKRNKILEREKTADLLPIAEEIVKKLLDKFGQPSSADLVRMGFEAKEENHASRDTTTSNAKDGAIRVLAGTGWKGSGDVPTNIRFIDSVSDQAESVGRRLRSVLKKNNSLEYGGRYRTGKILTKRLVRVRTAKDRKPFGRKIVKSNLSYAFAVSADVSGSMLDDFAKDPKMRGSLSLADYALSSLHMVGEALRIAGVERSLGIFAGHAVTINHINRLAVRWGDISNPKTQAKADNGSTETHLAIAKCADELKQVKAERKIMIILTDGQCDEYSAEKAYKKAQQCGIKGIGISIGDYGNLDKIFGAENHIRVKKKTGSSAIGNAFIQILKETITKSP